MPFDYLRIVYSFMFGVIWFAEVPGLWSFAGAAVIIGASVYLLRNESRRTYDQEQPSEQPSPKT